MYNYSTHTTMKRTIKAICSTLCVLASFCTCCAPDAGKAWTLTWAVIAAVSFIGAIATRRA